MLISFVLSNPVLGRLRLRCPQRSSAFTVSVCHKQVDSNWRLNISHTRYPYGHVLNRLYWLPRRGPFLPVRLTFVSLRLTRPAIHISGNHNLIRLPTSNYLALVDVHTVPFGPFPHLLSALRGLRLALYQRHIYSLIRINGWKLVCMNQHRGQQGKRSLVLLNFICHGWIPPDRLRSYEKTGAGRSFKARGGRCLSALSLPSPSIDSPRKLCPAVPPSCMTSFRVSEHDTKTPMTLTPGYGVLTVSNIWGDIV